jgi:phage portal protein BeeE
VALLAAQVDYASALFMKGLILNNADTGMIVTSEHHLLPAQMEQIQAALRERKSRAGQATRPLFLSGGVKVEKPALSAADLQFLENRKFTRQEILALFRVPETVLGFTEDANRAVTESQMLHWVLNVIAPLCRRLEAGLQPLVGAVAGPTALQGYFDLDELPEMQNARRLRVDAAAKLFSLGVPLNDINRALDLGLPAYAWGGTGWVASGLQPAGRCESDRP